jgi:hypothetical protein
MASGGGLHGWARLADGTLAVRFVAIEADAGRAAIEVLVRAVSREQAVHRAKQLGLHHVVLHDNPHPPGLDEISALLAAGQDLIWRSLATGTGWQPEATLPRLT